MPEMNFEGIFLKEVCRTDFNGLWPLFVDSCVVALKIINDIKTVSVIINGNLYALNGMAKEIGIQPLPGFLWPETEQSKSIRIAYNVRLVIGMLTDDELEAGQPDASRYLLDDLIEFGLNLEKGE